MGLFLYASSTEKTTVDFLSSCGLSTSYTTILRAHEILSASYMKLASEKAHGPHMLGIDNEQISMSQHVSQRPGAEPAVRSFTASIVYSLRNASPQACELRPILERRKNCPTITYNKHIVPSLKQKASIFKHLLKDIIEILFKNTDSFDPGKYVELLKHEEHRPPPEGYKTEEFVCPTLEYDESKTKDLMEFAQALYNNELKVADETIENTAFPSSNDQLTNVRWRRAVIERRGDLTALLRMENWQLGIGFFHDHMNLAIHLKSVHNGHPKDLGSLQFYRECLGTKRINNPRPDYFTLRHFFYDILYGNILHLWSLKTGYKNLDDYAKANPTLTELETIAQQILMNFASDAGLTKCTGSVPDEADITLRNAILLNRDLLYYYELDNAMSSGDFGRIEILMGTLTKMFAGSGGRNYAIEHLHLIQNLSISWPPEFA